MDRPKEKKPKVDHTGEYWDGFQWNPTKPPAIPPSAAAAAAAAAGVVGAAHLGVVVGPPPLYSNISARF